MTSAKLMFKSGSLPLCQDDILYLQCTVLILHKAYTDPTQVLLREESCCLSSAHGGTELGQQVAVCNWVLNLP